METMVQERIERTLEPNQTFSYTMTGFRRHVSAQDTILRIHKDVVEAKSTAQTCTVVGIDIKKAFGTVAYKPILEKAKTNKFGPRTMQYLTDFPINRLVKIKL